MKRGDRLFKIVMRVEPGDREGEVFLFEAWDEVGGVSPWPKRCGVEFRLDSADFCWIYVRRRRERRKFWVEWEPKELWGWILRSGTYPYSHRPIEMRYDVETGTYWVGAEFYYDEGAIRACDFDEWARFMVRVGESPHIKAGPYLQAKIEEGRRMVMGERPVEVDRYKRWKEELRVEVGRKFEKRGFSKEYRLYAGEGKLKWWGFVHPEVWTWVRAEDWILKAGREYFDVVRLNLAIDVRGVRHARKELDGRRRLLRGFVYVEKKGVEDKIEEWGSLKLYVERVPKRVGEKVGWVRFKLQDRFVEGDWEGDREEIERVREWARRRGERKVGV